MKSKQHAQRADEIFDVVNDRDEVIGQATRGEVHRRGLLHRAVHVLVFNACGDIFLQKRSLAKDSAPGCWASSCSGHVDSGEDYLTAAVRELDEEIGLKIAGSHLLTPILYAKPNADTEQEFVWVYRLQSEGPFVLHPAEIDSGKWFTVDELNREIAQKPETFSRSFRFLWTKILGQ